MTSEKVVLDADQKAVVEREIKSAYSALSTLLDWVKNDKLTVEMKEMLPGLVDSYMKEVKEVIGFTGDESERQKEMNESIGQYYQNEIRELKQSLANQNSIAGISANVKLAFEKIDKWWDIEGFNYIRKKAISANGCVDLEFGFVMDSLTSRFSKTPVSDNEILKTKAQYLTEKGFQFAPKIRGYGLDVIDNDKNRELLIEMVKQAFPTAKILAFSQYLRRTNNEKDDCYVLKGVEVKIYDLNDIETLEVKEKYFLFDKDEL